MRLKGYFIQRHNRTLFERKGHNMRTVFKLMIVMCTASLSLNATAQEKTAATYLQEGIFAQEIESDAAKAIDLYGKVIVDEQATDTFKAQAMLRQGQCYIQLDQDDQAALVLNHLLKTYPNQTQAIDQAKALLKDLVTIDPASVMPANTLAYVEIGNPGKQIETLLNMLQGTPLEASLQNTPSGPGHAGPQNIEGIIQALRNPIMISEFKKIRGLAMGVTGFPVDGPPPFVAVLFPGQSDALRGLLTVGLQMAGQPMTSINGLQAYQIEGGPAAAFDENALIIAYSKIPTHSSRTTIHSGLHRFCTRPDPQPRIHAGRFCGGTQGKRLDRMDRCRKIVSNTHEFDAQGTHAA